MKKPLFIILVIFFFTNTNVFGMEKFVYFLETCFCCCCRRCKKRKINVDAPPKLSTDSIQIIDLNPDQEEKNKGLSPSFTYFFETQTKQNNMLLLKVASEIIASKSKFKKLKLILIENVPFLFNDDVQQIKLCFERPPLMPELPTIFINAIITTQKAFLAFLEQLPYPVFNDATWLSHVTLEKYKRRQEITIFTNLSDTMARTLSVTHLQASSSGEMSNSSSSGSWGE